MDVSQRNFSVSDLLEKASGLGSLGSFSGLGSWGSFGGFHRSESELHFQDYLKRIPSTSALQQLGQDNNSGGAPTPPQLQQQQQQQQPVLQRQVLPAGTLGPMTAGSIPRVSSVDFLAQLASMQQQAAYGMAPKLDAISQPAAYLPTLTAADLATLNAATLAAPQFCTNPHAFAAALQHTSTAATSAMQLNQLAHQLHQQQPKSTTTPALSQGASDRQNSGPGSSNNDRDTEDGGGGQKTGVRRAKRMLSNRESARRSRRRKQEHLGQLESDINVLADEKKAWMDKIAGLERRMSCAEDENKRLREENERLLDELHFLRSELKERGSYARHNGRNASGDKSNASKRTKMEANENEEANGE